ncbi:putative tetratricopeptide-like helical domain superfamily [Helianthus debilis subsp. tardiflorus]
MLICFRFLKRRNPVSPIPEFTKILSVLVKRNHFVAAISLIKQFYFLGVNPILKHTIYVFNIAINCFCHLKRVVFLRDCVNDTLHQAIKFDRIVNNGFEPSVVSYRTLINGLCKSGDICSAVVLLQKMETSTCPTRIIQYSCVIDSLCKRKRLVEALKLFTEMKKKGVSPNVVTYTCLIHGLCSIHSWDEALELLSET